MWFGGYAPLPARLHNGEGGVNANQHARYCADLLATHRVAAFADMTVTSSTATIDRYVGAISSASTDRPTIASASGVTTLTWPASQVDAYDRRIGIKIVGATVTSNTAGVGANCSFTTTAVVVRGMDKSTKAAADCTFTLKVWAIQIGGTRIEDYGGDLLKENNLREYDAPGAWKWYQLNVDLQPNAYSQELSGTIVHARRLAQARLFSFVARMGELRVANSTPDRASIKLPYYVELLGARKFAGDSDADLRRRCRPLWKLALGPTRDNIERALEDLLGELFVGLVLETTDDLTTTPANHYWHYGTVGPTEFDLGGGTWSSGLAHIGVSVTHPTSGDLAAFLRLMDTEFFDMMDRDLPYWCTFGWSTTGVDPLVGGFQLDIDQLDFAGLG